MSAILLSLFLVDFTPLGVVVNGAKDGLILQDFNCNLRNLQNQLLFYCLQMHFVRMPIYLIKQMGMGFFPIIAMAGLIFIQPNLSMVILLGMTTVVMYMAAGGSMKLFLSCVGTMFVTVVIGLTTIIKPYQLQRLKTWRHPESDPLGAGYNIIQSLIAFASGGFSGVGYGGSIQKLSYLPECHTDFIFAIIAEELGFVGCVLVIGLFFTFMQRGFVIAARCPDMYGKLLAVGITFSIVFRHL